MNKSLELILDKYDESIKRTNDRLNREEVEFRSAKPPRRGATTRGEFVVVTYNKNKNEIRVKYMKDGKAGSNEDMFLFNKPFDEKEILNKTEEFLRKSKILKRKFIKKN